MSRFRVRVELVDEIGKAKLVAGGVVQGHEEVTRRQQLADDRVDAPEQLGQVVVVVRGLGDAVQRRLHARVAHVLGDVAEAVHAAGVDAVHDQRLRAALDHAPVEELDLRAGTFEGVAVDRVEALEGGLGMLQLRQHVVHRSVHAGIDHVRRQPPHIAETAVAAQHVALQVGDQDAVGGRLEGRRQLG